MLGIASVGSESKDEQSLNKKFVSLRSASGSLATPGSNPSSPTSFSMDIKNPSWGSFGDSKALISPKVSNIASATNDSEDVSNIPSVTTDSKSLLDQICSLSLQGLDQKYTTAAVPTTKNLISKIKQIDEEIRQIQPPVIQKRQNTPPKSSLLSFQEELTNIYNQHTQSIKHINGLIALLSRDKLNVTELQRLLSANEYQRYLESCKISFEEKTNQYRTKISTKISSVEEKSSMITHFLQEDFQQNTKLPSQQELLDALAFQQKVIAQFARKIAKLKKNLRTLANLQRNFSGKESSPKIEPDDKVNVNFVASRGTSGRKQRESRNMEDLVMRMVESSGQLVTPRTPKKLLQPKTVVMNSSVHPTESQRSIGISPRSTFSRTGRTKTPATPLYGDQPPPSSAPKIIPSTPLFSETSKSSPTLQSFGENLSFEPAAKQHGAIPFSGKRSDLSQSGKADSVELNTTSKKRKGILDLGQPDNKKTSPISSVGQNSSSSGFSLMPKPLSSTDAKSPSSALPSPFPSGDKVQDKSNQNESSSFSKPTLDKATPSFDVASGNSEFSLSASKPQTSPFPTTPQGPSTSPFGLSQTKPNSSSLSAQMKTNISGAESTQSVFGQTSNISGASPLAGNAPKPVNTSTTIFGSSNTPPGQSPFSSLSSNPSASPFATQTSTGGFGLSTPNSNTSPQSTQGSASLFGAPTQSPFATQRTPSTPGQSPFASQASSPSIFGNPAATSAQTPAQSPGQSPFSTPGGNSSIFGNPTGSSQTPGQSPFASQASGGTSSVFGTSLGNNPAQSPFASQGGGGSSSVFGTSLGNRPTGTGLQTPAQSPFSSPSGGNSSIFGSGNTQTPGQSPFASQASGGASSVFGNNPAQSPFGGSASVSVFGQSQSLANDSSLFAPRK